MARNAQRANGKGSASSWLRRIVPAGYAEATLTLEGTSPLLMHSVHDKDSELYRAFFLLGQKSKKSLDDHARLREMEWKLNLYFDEELGPFIPGKNVKELIRASATKYRKGTEISRSLVVLDYRIPLAYDGPRDVQGLWDGGFRFTTLVANGGPNRGRVDRCRPMFEHWSLSAPIAYDPEEIDEDFLHVVIERTQKFGLGDYRPEFGAFRATLTPAVIAKESANGSAISFVDAHDQAAHGAFVDRVKAGV